MSPLDQKLYKFKCLNDNIESPYSRGEGFVACNPLKELPEKPCKIDGHCCGSTTNDATNETYQICQPSGNTSYTTLSGK